MAGLLVCIPALAAAKALPQATATHCRAGEKPLYSCRFGRAIGSVCGAPGAIHYRYGPAGHPEIDVANDAGWTNIREGGVTGGGGGRQSHIRVTRGAWHYIVFWGFAGELTEVPGQQWSGIAVVRKDGSEHVLTCPGQALIASDPIASLYASAPSRLNGKLEDQDQYFDAWY